MEQRALVILFTGNKIPDEQLGKICNIICKTAFAHPNDVTMMAFGEDDLAKLLAQKIMNTHSTTHRTNAYEDVEVAFTTLKKEYPLEDTVAMVVHFGRNIAEIYGRVKYGKAIQHDIDLINNVRIILNNRSISEKYAKENFNSQLVQIIQKIFNNYFDEKGNAR